MAKEGDGNIRYMSGRLIECDNCHSICRLPMTITQGMLPVVLTCPVCGTTRNLSGMVIPKVDPLQHVAGDWNITGTESIESGPVEGEAEDEEPPLMFQEFADLLRINMAQGIGLVTRLEERIDEFVKEMAAAIQHNCIVAQRFEDSWKPEFLKDFVKMPFSMMNVPCMNPDMARYSVAVLSPKIYEPKLGFHIGDNGGMRVELVNPFSRLARQLDPELCKLLAVPEPLDLYVRGQKIMGPSLVYCWNKIPGCVTDRDHTPQQPSIRIDNNGNVSARSWLASRGVHTYESKPIHENEIVADHPLIPAPEMVSAWHRLMAHGRIGVFWKNQNMARTFAVFAMQCIKGPGMVVPCTQKSATAWNGFIEQTNRMFSMKYHHRITEDLLERARVVVLDLTDCGMTDVNVPDVWHNIKDIFRYQGIVIVLSDSPINDFDSANFIDSLIHALASYTVLEGRPVPEVDETVEQIAARRRASVYNNKLWQYLKTMIKNK